MSHLDIGFDMLHIQFRLMYFKKKEIQIYFYIINQS